MTLEHAQGAQGRAPSDNLAALVAASELGLTGAGAEATVGVRELAESLSGFSEIRIRSCR